MVVIRLLPELLVLSTINRTRPNTARGMEAVPLWPIRRVNVRDSDNGIVKAAPDTKAQVTQPPRSTAKSRSDSKRAKPIPKQTSDCFGCFAINCIRNSSSSFNILPFISFSFFPWLRRHQNAPGPLARGNEQSRAISYSRIGL